ncbi:MAG: hypothetical protein RRY12_10790 [Cloacibacillus sp.]
MEETNKDAVTETATEASATVAPTTETAAAGSAAEGIKGEGGARDVTVTETAEAGKTKREGLLGGENAAEKNAATETSAEKAEEGKAEPDKADEAEKPLEYTDFKLADGMVADDESLKEFKELASSKKLSQEEAQRLIDIQNRLMKTNSERFVAEVDKQTNALIDKWEGEVRSDEELGGANLAATISTARKAVTQLGVPEVFDILNEANLASNPAIIRLLYRAGKALGEAKYAYGVPNTGKSDVSAAQAIYGEMN